MRVKVIFAAHLCAKTFKKFLSKKSYKCYCYCEKYNKNVNVKIININMIINNK